MHWALEMSWSPWPDLALHCSDETQQDAVSGGYLGQEPGLVQNLLVPAAVHALGISSHAELSGLGLQQLGNLGLDPPFEPLPASVHKENRAESSDRSS